MESVGRVKSFSSIEILREIHAFREELQKLGNEMRALREVIAADRRKLK